MELFNPNYIFDSGPFIDLNNYPPDIFKGFWANLAEMLETGKILSCSEVYREIENYNDEYVADWTKSNKRYFHKPTPDQQELVRDILRKFPNLVNPEAILAGKPYADPFVIAQAKSYECILVHKEKFKPNAHKIPNVCAAFGVQEMSLFEFLRREGWQF